MTEGGHPPSPSTPPLPPTEHRYAAWGACASIIWIAIAFGMMWWKWSQAKNMPLNEWGDFLAGVFAPLAFFWLVLGFLQQGKELKVSSAALLLQVKELRDSVQQQQAMVRVAQQSYRVALDEQLRQKEKEQAADAPRFVLAENDDHKYYALSGNGVRVPVVLRNEGATVTNLHFEFHPALEEPPKLELSALHGDSDHRLDVVVSDENMGFDIVISYTDRHFRRDSQRFRAAVVRNGSVRLRFEQLASAGPDVPASRDMTGVGRT